MSSAAVSSGTTKEEEKIYKLYAIDTNTMQHLEFFQGTSLSTKPVQGYKCSHPSVKAKIVHFCCVYAQ